MPGEGVLPLPDGDSGRPRPPMNSHDADPAATRSRAWESAVVGAALDCIVVIDGQGVIKEFNPAAERTFGYSRDEAVGRELAELIIPERLRDRHRAGLAGIQGGGDSKILGRRLEMVAIGATRQEFPVELTVARLSDEPLA